MSECLFGAQTSNQAGAIRGTGLSEKIDQLLCFLTSFTPNENSEVASSRNDEEVVFIQISRTRSDLRPDSIQI